MKKVLALIIAAMMIVSMIPVMAITTSAADVDGNWTTWRSAGGYEEPEEGEEEAYTPAPGYEYNDEGLHMTSANYANCTPFGTIQSIEPMSIKDGIYMELRVDQYGYAGEDGTADHWISFNLWDSQKVAPGNTNDYGQGWLSLCRTPGAGGSGSAQSFNSGTNLWQHHGDVAITPVLNEEGKEVYTFEVSYDGTNYTIAICGVAVQGGPAITQHLNSLNADGEFYVGVTFHTGATGTNLEATMLKFGTSAEDAEVPVGTDSKDPEDNPIVIADIVDSSTVAEGQPCMIFDATESSWGGKISTQYMEMEAQGNGAFKLMPSEVASFYMWSVKKSMSYQAADFPVIAIMIEDPNQIFESGMLRYCAGDNMTANDTYMVGYSIYDENYDDNCKYYGADSEYTLMIIDLREYLDEEKLANGWTGRINSLRFDGQTQYLNTPADPEEDYYFMHWTGIFRSVEDAAAYGDAYMENAGVSEAPTEEVEDPTEEPTEEATEEPTEEATDAPTAGTDAEAKTEAATKAEETEGCASVIGSVAVLMAAAAAAIVLKKRD